MYRSASAKPDGRAIITFKDGKKLTFGKAPHLKDPSIIKPSDMYKFKDM